MLEFLHPESYEIREWAFNEYAFEPCQDWHLILECVQHEPVYLELASDESCPKRHYFLRLLYLIVGDAVRTEYRNRPRAIIEGFIERGDQYRHPDIRLWQQRSRYLMRHPESFNYRDWCAGGLASDNVP